MAYISWVKINVDMFDNKKIKYIRTLPDGNNICLIWIMLLTMAGRCNANGTIFLTEKVPYTLKMLIDTLGFKEKTIKAALSNLETLGMIHTDGDGYITITGWADHQNVDGMEKIREQTRQRQRKFRAEHKKSIGINPDDKCAYCGDVATTIDHIVPVSKGGLDVPENVVPSCLQCNQQKINKDLADFLNCTLMFPLQFKVNHSLVQSDDRLMKHVTYNASEKRYVTLQVTQCNATEKEREKEREELLYPSYLAEKNFSDSAKNVEKPVENCEDPLARAREHWEALRQKMASGSDHAL